jgi:hypothetical protein
MCARRTAVITNDYNSHFANLVYALGAKKVIGYFMPIMHARVFLFMKVVGRVKKYALPVKSCEMTRIVVNQEIYGQDTLVATKHDVARWDERKILL